MGKGIGAKGILILLSTYILLQLLWWAYIIINLQSIALPAEALYNKHLMIVGEGVVFISLLAWGFYKLNHSIKKEIQISRQQQNFLLSVTHEIKTPLTALKLSLQTLARNKNADVTTSQILQHALKEQIRLEHFVEDIFAVNALEDHRWESKQKTLNLNTFISDIASNLQSVYPANHIQITCPNFEVTIDDKALHIVLSNLIENACKYSPFCGKVVVDVKDLQSSFKVYVKDEGEGIDIEFQKQVFKKFYRLGNEEKRKSKGSGLGLYLVKSFTDYLNGKITLQNNQPKGSIFILEIPK